VVSVINQNGTSLRASKGHGGLHQTGLRLYVKCITKEDFSQPGELPYGGEFDDLYFYGDSPAGRLYLAYMLTHQCHHGIVTIPAHTRWILDGQYSPLCLSSGLMNPALWNNYFLSIIMEGVRLTLIHPNVIILCKPWSGMREYTFSARGNIFLPVHS